MLTYVINTSENRTLDSDRLFELTGYNKIKWLNCRLSDVALCAQHIFEKQNVLGADRFRIAVLVDFYSFDRIRLPYRRHGYKAETGVDIGLYLPFIETYLYDNLLEYLENRELSTSDFEIYYIQNTKLEQFDFVNNARSQLSQILSGIPDGETEPGFDEVRTFADGQSECDCDEPTVVKEERFAAFSLYCSPAVSLDFRLSDYPYGDDRMGISRFLDAFYERIGQRYDVKRHYYVSNYGGGMARAAFDTLTLSLYLIRMYEREEDSPEEGEIEIGHIEAEDLKDHLIRSWNKINYAKYVAKNNSTSYYSLKENVHVDNVNIKPKTASGVGAITADDLDRTEKLSPAQMHKRVAYYHGRTSEQLAADKRSELDRLMNNYLVHRDETRDIDIQSETEQSIREGALITTAQFPSEEEYSRLVKEKQHEISARFERVLGATFLKQDFTKEKERADEAFETYSQAKACLNRNIIGDIIFMILALLVSVGPYVVLQLTKFSVKALEALTLGTQTLGLFFGLFVLAAIIQFTIISVKLVRAKSALKDAYIDAKRKELDSMVQLRTRYEEDLLYIERTRYELRQLKYLYELNLNKDNNIKRHRELLEELDDHLASMLNKLDVEPISDPDENVSGIFDITKPIRSRENRIYRIFSLDTIERLFSKKGREET